MINNSEMYFNNSNNVNAHNNYFAGGCCMQGNFTPYYPFSQDYYMRGNSMITQSFNQPHNGCPYVMSNMQYSPAVNCFNAAGVPSIMEEEEYIGYINPAQLNMRTVSIEDIID